jgi:membrane fusion protein, multidrug efflux system
LRPALGASGIALAALVLSSCGHGGEGANGVPTPPPPAVEVATVTRATVPITEDFVGTSGAVTSVEVRARVTGTLESAPFKEGTLVRKGQLIFTIQPTQYEAQVQAAQASLTKGQADLRSASDTAPILQAAANVAQKRAMLERQNIAVSRLTPLAAAKAVPQKDLDNAITSQEAARADLLGALAQLHNATVEKPVNIQIAQSEILQAQSQTTDAKLNLSYTTIYAPVTGLIGFLKYDVGNVVGGAGTGTEVLDTITTVDPIKVDFAVDENTYLSLAGRTQATHERPLLLQPVDLVLANNAIYPYPGRLYTLNPTLDPRTATISVEARFPNPDAQIRPGQFARIRLVVQERKDAVLVPQTAVVQAQGTDNAYLVQSDGVIAQRSLTLGPRYQDSFVVESGLSPGDRVVVQGTQKVRPGLKVQVVNGSLPASPKPKASSSK